LPKRDQEPGKRRPKVITNKRCDRKEKSEEKAMGGLNCHQKGEEHVI